MIPIASPTKTSFKVCLSKASLTTTIEKTKVTIKSVDSPSIKKIDRTRADIPAECLLGKPPKS